MPESSTATKEVPTSDIVKDLPRPTREHIQIVEKLWEERARELGYQKNTKKYANMEVEFFIGATMAFSAIYGDHATPAKWALCLMSGRPIVE